MKRKTIVLTLLILVLSMWTVIPLLFAEEGGGGGDSGGTKYRRKTVIDFDDVLLEGELKKPAGSYITERSEMKFKKLINKRNDFRKEMYKSTDKLK